MVGSDAVVAFPTQGTVLEYDLDSKVTSYQAMIRLSVYTTKRSAHMLDVSSGPPPTHSPLLLWLAFTGKSYDIRRFIRVPLSMIFIISHVAQMSLLNQPSSLQEITETAVEKAVEVTSLSFSRPTTPVGEGKLPLLANAGAPTTIIWAFGTSETFDYHFPKGRGAFSFDLLCSAMTSRKGISRNAPGGVSVTPSPLVSPMEHFTAGPSSSRQIPYDSNGGAVLEPFGLSTRDRIRTVGVAGAMLVGVCTFLLATTGLFK